MISSGLQGNMVHSISIRLGLIFAAIFAFSLFAAASAQSLPGPMVGVQPPQSPASAPAVESGPLTSSISDENYRLGAGDKVKVVVYGETDLSGEFPVNGSGQVQFPLVGQVAAAGLTIHEFIAELHTALADGYLKDPKISVEVQSFRPFYIMGEINKPGEYPYESGLTVRSAIALAGGYTYRADHSDVYIRRKGEANELKVDADSEARVFPGDIIRIPERFF